MPTVSDRQSGTGRWLPPGRDMMLDMHKLSVVARPEKTARSIRVASTPLSKKDICIHKDPANFQRDCPTTG
jgi:hypothetical protein